MVINKRSWHYRLYKGTYTIFHDQPPKNSNLCSYMQRLFFGIPFFYGGWVQLMAFYILVLGPLSLLFGRYPSFHFDDNQKNYMFGSYPGLTLRGFTLYPWMLAIPGFFLWANIGAFLHSCHGNWIVVPVAESVLVFIAGIVALAMVSSARPQDFGYTIKEWFAAKKAGVCPLVSFVDEEEEVP
jgi:hypothetical protein